MSFEERKAYLEALMFIASADQEITKDEMTYFYDIASSDGLTNEEADAINEELKANTRDLGEIVSTIKDHDMKLKLLSTLMELCHIDGQYTEDEKAAITEICNLLEVDGIELKKIEMAYWANEGMKNIKKGLNVLKKGVAFAEEKGLEGSKYAARSISKGISKANTKLSMVMANAKKLREENQKLRDELKKNTLTETVKQKVILQLNEKIALLTNELKRERERNIKNEEIIRLLQAQIEDLEQTIEVAESVRTA